MEVTIYALKDPRDERLRYVGRTRVVNQRQTVHCGDTKQTRSQGQNPRLFGWKQELRDAGLSPVFEVLEIVPEEEAKLAERHWVETVSRRENLFNKHFNPYYLNPRKTKR